MAWSCIRLALLLLATASSTLAISPTCLTVPAAAYDTSSSSVHILHKNVARDAVCPGWTFTIKLTFPTARTWRVVSSKGTFQGGGANSTCTNQAAGTTDDKSATNLKLRLDCAVTGSVTVLVLSQGPGDSGNLLTTISKPIKALKDCPESRCAQVAAPSISASLPPPAVASASMPSVADTTMVDMMSELSSGVTSTPLRLVINATTAMTVFSGLSTVSTSSPQADGAIQTAQELLNMVPAIESEALIDSMRNFLDVTANYLPAGAAMDSMQQQLPGAVLDLVRAMAGMAGVTATGSTNLPAAKVSLQKVLDSMSSLMTFMPVLGATPVTGETRDVAGKPNPTTPAGTQSRPVASSTPPVTSSTAPDTATPEQDTTAAADNASDTTISTDAIGSQGRNLLYQGGRFSSAWQHEYGSFKSRWHPTVLKSVFKAQQMLSSTSEQRARRMFVPMLSNRHSELCCMLTDLNNNVGATNALDVYVFTVENKAQQEYKRSPCLNRKFNITVVFLPLDEHWGAAPRSSSSAVHDAAGWVALPGLFREDYRRMGHWRLTFPFAFADLLGYKYVWQLDDDSWFKKPVDFDMMAYMQQHDLWVAGARTLTDPHFVTWGLPEIVRLFLVGERMAPAGSLFSNHTQPRGLEGLYTVRADPVHTEHPLKGDEGGWSRAVMYGNNIIMDLNKFWWPKEVQKFVELVVQTGYHWRFRWNEQGVMAMVWQIFVPDGHYQFDNLPIEYHHPRKTWGNCDDDEQRVS